MAMLIRLPSWDRPFFWPSFHCLSPPISRFPSQTKQAAPRWAWLTVWCLDISWLLRYVLDITSKSSFVFSAALDSMWILEVLRFIYFYSCSTHINFSVYVPLPRVFSLPLPFPLLLPLGCQYVWFFLAQHAAGAYPVPWWNAASSRCPFWSCKSLSE